MSAVDFVAYFCEAILDIAWHRAQDVLGFDDALKVRDIGDEIVDLIKTTLGGCLDHAMHDYLMECIDNRLDYALIGFNRFVCTTPDWALDDLVQRIQDAYNEKFCGNDEDDEDDEE